MQTTDRAHGVWRSRFAPEVEPPPRIEGPARERDARAEIDRLRDEIERLVRQEGELRGRDAIDSALESVTRLQVVTANLDACKPPSQRLAGAALVALADARLYGHADAIERGITYTADNQIRLLQTPQSESPDSA
jgi:hypothetical protein